VTLADLQRLSKVFDDAKHCVASLRQLSFLYGELTGKMDENDQEFNIPAQNFTLDAHPAATLPF